MGYRVEVDRAADKFLDRLTDARLLRRLREALLDLAGEPRPPGAIRMQGERELYRIRVGDYRIIYRIEDAVLRVLVVKVGHRREIYR